MEKRPPSHCLLLTRRLVFLKVLPHKSHFCYSEVNKCVTAIHQLFNLVPLASFTSHTSCFLPRSSIFMTVIFTTRTIAFSSLLSALSAPSPNHCYIIIISIIKVNTNGSLCVTPCSSNINPPSLFFCLSLC